MKCNEDIQTAVRLKLQAIVNARGLDLIECKVTRLRSGWAIKVLIDYPGGGVTIKECSAVNTALRSFLEEEVSCGDYTIEVNSPGLDRPLRERSDFQRVKSKAISIWFKETFQDKKYLEGIVEDVLEDAVVVACKDKTYRIPFASIQCAKNNFRK